MREVIQCLIDWLNKEPSDEKSHRILRALANESIKKADFKENKRRFTAEEQNQPGGRIFLDDRP